MIPAVWRLHGRRCHAAHQPIGHPHPGQVDGRDVMSMLTDVACQVSSGSLVTPDDHEGAALAAAQVGCRWRYPHLQAAACGVQSAAARPKHVCRIAVRRRYVPLACWWRRNWAGRSASSPTSPCLSFMWVWWARLGARGGCNPGAAPHVQPQENTLGGGGDLTPPPPPACRLAAA